MHLFARTDLGVRQRRHPIVTSYSIVTDGLTAPWQSGYCVGRSNHKNVLHTLLTAENIPNP